MNEQDIPIAIHSNKLIDWLISRRHCNKDWHEKVTKIREKINNALDDMPAHDEIVKLLSGSYINYFHCLRIVEILKETEADTKNIFGRYGSQRMKDWQEIIHLYQKDNVYLAEAAQILVRNVNYEVPSLKKQIAKLEQLQIECLKKEKEFAKSENACLNEFSTLCKQLGIPGVDIKKELVELLKELPVIYENVAKHIKSISTPVEYYTAFQNLVADESTSLPLLRHIIEHGNTTVYEWIYKEKPVSVEEPELNVRVDDKVKLEEQISEINFDDVTFDQGDIDWGIETEDDTSNIDFNISANDVEIIVEGSGVEGRIARGSDAFTLLDDPKTRSEVLDEVMGLEAFLTLRLFELSAEADLLSVSQLQNAPDIVQMQSRENVEAMLKSVEVIVTSLTSKQAVHLHNIKHNPKYIDMLVDTLKQKNITAERLENSKGLMVAKVRELRQQALNIEPLIDRIVKNTKIIQEQIEKEISKKYKNRVVNIIGGVNTL